MYAHSGCTGMSDQGFYLYQLDGTPYVGVRPFEVKEAVVDDVVDVVCGQAGLLHDEDGVEDGAEDDKG